MGPERPYGLALWISIVAWARKPQILLLVWSSRFTCWSSKRLAERMTCLSGRRHLYPQSLRITPEWIVQSSTQHTVKDNLEDVETAEREPQTAVTDLHRLAVAELSDTSMFSTFKERSDRLQKTIESSRKFEKGLKSSSYQKTNKQTTWSSKLSDQIW